MSTLHQSMRSIVRSKEFEGIAESTAYRADPRLLRVEEGFNARPLDREHIDSFKKSILAKATIPRIIVKVIDGNIVIRDGHHRHAAYMELIAEGQDIRSVELDEFKGSDADAVALLLTSAQGKALTPMQAGKQYAKLIAFGWTPGEIAAKVGKTSQHVGQMLKLTEMPSDVQGMVTAGEVPAQVALAAVKTHGTGAKEVLGAAVAKAKTNGKAKATAKDVVEKKMTLEEAIKHEMIAGIRAEVSTPQFAHLIDHLRKTP